MERGPEAPSDAPPGTTVGVVIRTLDEAEWIGTCLEALRGQRSRFELDVLVVDSGSEDATREIVRSRGVRLYDLPPGDFGYSSSLNLGIEQVRGDLVLILSAHAIPVDEHWVARMTGPFDDAQVAGVASRQVPHEDAPWQEVVRLERQFGRTARAYSGGNSDGIVFSNAASCIRRSVWRDEPFRLPAAEDLEWARRVVGAGWTVVYEPAAAVYHSHAETPRAQAQRLIDITRAATAETGPRTRWRTLREAARIVRHDSGSIMRLDEPVRQKLTHLAELVRVAWHYVADFERSGTTAERRREDS